MFLVGTYGVAQKAKELSDYRSGIQDGTDLQADLRTGDLDDEEDLDEDEKGPEAEPAKEKSLECRGSQECLLTCLILANTILDNVCLFSVKFFHLMYFSFIKLTNITFN